MDSRHILPSLGMQIVECPHTPVRLTPQHCVISALQSRGRLASIPRVELPRMQTLYLVLSETQYRRRRAVHREPASHQPSKPKGKGACRGGKKGMVEDNLHSSHVGWLSPRHKLGVSACIGSYKIARSRHVYIHEMGISCSMSPKVKVRQQ